MVSMVLSGLKNNPRTRSSAPRGRKKLLIGGRTDGQEVFAPFVSSCIVEKTAGPDAYSLSFGALSEDPVSIKKPEWLPQRPFRLQRGSERDFRRELHDPRARAEVKLRTKWSLERSPRRNEAQVRVGSARARRCIGGRGVLRRAHRRIVHAVERVIGFQNQLRLHALGDGNALRDSRIERNEVRQIERVPAQPGSPVRAAVAVGVQVEVHQARIGLPALRGEDGAKLPAAQQVARAGGKAAGVAVQVPDGTEDKA